MGADVKLSFPFFKKRYIKFLEANIRENSEYPVIVNGYLNNDYEVFSDIMITEARLLLIFLWGTLLFIISCLSNNTKLGVSARATVIDPEMASSCGVDVEKIRYMIFFVGSAFAAIAGVMVSLLNNLVEPTMGSVPSYKALAIIVLGGLGNVKGALLASLALGIIESFGTIYLCNILDRDSIAFAFLILVLMIKPNGLLSKG